MIWPPDTVLAHSTLRVLGGRRYWVLPFLPLAWLVVTVGVALLDESWPGRAAAQGELIGLPMTILAIFLGIRVIAGEIDERTLEIAYTVPGGCERVWWAKLFCALGLLLVAQAMLATVTFAFITSFPAGALYGALQSAMFYLVVAMALAALFRSEAAGALGTVALLGFNGLITGIHFF